MALVSDVETVIGEVAGRVGPAVVGLGRGWGGSGVVVAPGRVLTNAHNLRHDEVTITFADGRQVTGRVAGSDGDVDVAVVEVDTGEIEPVEWASGDDEVSIGRTVFALANPAGRGLRVTPGFVSSTARSFRGPRGRRIAGAVEHTAPLPRGSSGGPLVNSDGRLIGINSVRVDGGLILAIGADSSLQERVAALGRGETPKRLRLGVAIAPPRVARKLRGAVGLPERDGVLVRAVEEGGPADRAGIERGDLIVAAAGVEIDRVDRLYEALDTVRAESSLELTVVRGTDERAITVNF